MAARSLFSLVRYRPVSVAALVRAPILFLVAGDDTATSTRPTEQAAHDAPHAELRRYPGTHFSAYRATALVQVFADEVELLLAQFADRSASVAEQ